MSGIPMIWTGLRSYFFGDGDWGLQRPIISFGGHRLGVKEKFRKLARDEWEYDLKALKVKPQ
jgi:hypothetical protein